VAPILAALGLGVWAAVELGLRGRTPEARTMRAGADDAGTTRITAVAGLGCWLAPWLWRAVAGAGPLGRAGTLAAAVVLALGLALRIWAMRTLGTAFTRTLVAGAGPLVERGPYQVLRHPGYAAALLVLPAHAALASGRLAAAAAVAAVLATVYAHRIAAEEALLARHFGAAWQRYRQRTARLLPGVY